MYGLSHCGGEVLDSIMKMQPTKEDRPGITPQALSQEYRCRVSSPILKASSQMVERQCLTFDGGEPEFLFLNKLAWAAGKRES